MREARKVTASETATRDAWTKDEIVTLLELASWKSPHLFPALAFALGTGCRRGEILGLRWEDVDLARRRVQIRRVPTGEGKGKTRVPKTGGRIVPLSPDLVDLLDQLSRDRVRRPSWVFCSPRGYQWQERNFTRAWETLREKAAIKGVRALPFHCTRHTYITLALEAGMPAKQVSDRVGASVATIEAHYAHAVPVQDDSFTVLPMGTEWGQVGTGESGEARNTADLMVTRARFERATPSFGESRRSE